MKFSQWVSLRPPSQSITHWVTTESPTDPANKYNNSVNDTGWDWLGQWTTQLVIRTHTHRLWTEWLTEWSVNNELMKSSQNNLVSHYQSRGYNYYIINMCIIFYVLQFQANRSISFLCQRSTVIDYLVWTWHSQRALFIIPPLIQSSKNSA